MALFFLKNSSLFKNQSLQSSLMTMGLEYEYKELEKGITFFNQMFQPILQLEKGDKIGIQDAVNDVKLKYVDLSQVNFNLYLDKYKIYQSLSRWYYKQNRKDIFEKLNLLFDSYNILTKRIKVVYTNYNVKFEKLFNDVVTLNKNIVIKLNLLSETYADPDICPIIKNQCDILTNYSIIDQDLKVSLPKYSEENDNDLTVTKDSELTSSIESIKSDKN